MAVNLASLNASMSLLRHLKLRAKARALEDDLFQAPFSSDKAKMLLRLVKLLVHATEHDCNEISKVAPSFSARVLQLVQQNKSDRAFVWLLLLSYGSFVVLWSHAASELACSSMQALQDLSPDNDLQVTLLPATLRAKATFRMIRDDVTAAEAEAALCIVRASARCLPVDLQVCTALALLATRFLDTKLQQSWPLIVISSMLLFVTTCRMAHVSCPTATGHLSFAWIGESQSHVKFQSSCRM